MKKYDINSILKSNSYPGRGIALGLTPDGESAVFVYFIMGRSVNSRNRIFVKENNDIFTKAFDETKLSDPSLIIYAPVRTCEKYTVVTNGDQTDTIWEFLSRGSTFESALETREFEPDAPNYTPRISSILDFRDGFKYKMSILKSADESGIGCNRFTYSYEPIRGTGHFIHTYISDGNPLPTFEGEPEPIEIPSDFESFVNGVWEDLDSDNKISLVARKINLLDGKIEEIIKNKNK